MKEPTTPHSNARLAVSPVRLNFRQPSAGKPLGNGLYWPWQTAAAAHLALDPQDKRGSAARIPSLKRMHPSDASAPLTCYDDRHRSCSMSHVNNTSTFPFVLTSSLQNHCRLTLAHAYSAVSKTLTCVKPRSIGLPARLRSRPVTHKLNHKAVAYRNHGSH
jgi:hypothetical protein